MRKTDLRGKKEEGEKPLFYNPDSKIHTVEVGIGIGSFEAQVEGDTRGFLVFG